jgi:hypothetical protein
MNGGPCRVGLIVTGRGEETFLQDLFNRTLMQQANCLFSIIGRIHQLPPATSDLRNMLEAYYFAHANAVNSVAGQAILAADHPTDVEDIRHPKRELTRLWPGRFREIDDGRRIVASLDLSHVLARPAECCWLRSMIAWCLDRFRERNAVYPGLLEDAYCVKSGQKAPLTYPQSGP